MRAKPAQERRPTGSRLRRESLGWPSPARDDLAVELVALEHLVGLLGDVLAQVRVMRVDEAVEVLPG
eukprot:2706822-Alexandrium_andersonii.AAC.1